MNPVILLIGRNGQIGWELSRLLPGLAEVIALDRGELELTRLEDIRRKIRCIRPAIIINAAAFTNVDLAESNQTIARIVNADAPAVMAEEAKNLGAIFIHYSTDYVLDGFKAAPYQEMDQPSPLNVYGRTKLEGERAVEQVGAVSFIFRTAWVYSRRGKNFLLTVLRLGIQNEELRIVQDQIGAPTWSREIARATVRVLERLVTQDLDTSSRMSGLYHLSAAGETSWHGFAVAILEEFASCPPGAQWILGVTGGRPLISRRIQPISSGEFPTAARRPSYSVLSNHRISQVFGVRLPDWRAQLHAAFSEDNDS